MSSAEEDWFPPEGRLAGVDFGTARIGIAICDPDRILCSPLTVFDASDWQSSGAAFEKLAKDERIEGWVVGLPIHLDGKESESSEQARKFAGWLLVQTDLPVVLFDERFTTVDASGRLRGAKLTTKKKKKRIDAVAASVLLESFLEAWRYKDQVPGQAATVDKSSFESNSEKRSSAARLR